MIRKNIYRWHRWLSLIAAVPIIMWSVSGLLHQANAWVRPVVKNERLAEVPLDTAAIGISLSAALQLNNIPSISNCRIVQYEGQYYYQVRVTDTLPALYLSTADGQLLEDGDKKYAVALAHHILGDSSLPVHKAERVTRFSGMYRASSKLLPVYAVHLHDADDTHVYVDTYGSRLAMATNRHAHQVHQWFGYLHAWKFLDRWKDAKEWALALFAIIAFAAAASGMYLYAILPAMSRQKRHQVWNRRRNQHRVIGIITSCTLLFFAFSGAYRALVKNKPTLAADTHVTDRFASNQLDVDLKDIVRLLNNTQRLLNISLAAQGDQPAVQLLLEEGKGQRSLAFYSPVNRQITHSAGDYAAALAMQWKKVDAENIASVELITAFNNEYRSTNKRLPVYKVSLLTPENDRLYIETTTGYLAAAENNQTARSNFVFSHLHMFRFMESVSKDFRFWLLMFFAWLNLLTVVTGLVLGVRSVVKRNRRPNTTTPNIALLIN
jgi:hypothetical protein